MSSEERNMAKRTSTDLRNEVIYSIYVRAHTPEGTFRAIEPDLERIKALGTTIIWFMPIHPIGIEGKKGSLGCPYSIRDYRAVNPEYGTLEDFTSLVDKIHALGMKVIIDVVYNHTSHDSVLAVTHPEYFHQDEQGKPCNRFPEWEDVYDLNYNIPELCEYQIETLCEWAKLVDGFRCDVPTMVPAAFWEQAAQRVAEVNPNAIWLAEVGGPGFMRTLERLGIPWWCESDLMHDAFDMTYDYDGYDHLKMYLSGQIPLSFYTRYLCMQNGMNSRNYVKLRFLENHDQPRAKQRIPDQEDLVNFTAFYFFLFGPALIFGGQEYCDPHQPSLFERDPFDRTGEDISPMLTTLSALKKDPLFAEGYFDMQADNEKQTAIGTYRYKDRSAVGVFRLKAAKGTVSVPLEDGTYTNELTSAPVKVQNGTIDTACCPVIIMG